MAKNKKQSVSIPAKKAAHQPIFSKWFGVVAVGALVVTSAIAAAFSANSSSSNTSTIDFGEDPLNNYDFEFGLDTNSFGTENLCNSFSPLASAYFESPKFELNDLIERPGFLQLKNGQRRKEIIFMGEDHRYRQMLLGCTTEILDTLPEDVKVLMILEGRGSKHSLLTEPHDEATRHIYLTDEVFGEFTEERICNHEKVVDCIGWDDLDSVLEVNNALSLSSEQLNRAVLNTFNARNFAMFKTITADDVLKKADLFIVHTGKGHLVAPELEAYDEFHTALKVLRVYHDHSENFPLRKTQLHVYGHPGANEAIQALGYPEQHNPYEEVEETSQKPCTLAGPNDKYNSIKGRRC